MSEIKTPTPRDAFELLLAGNRRRAAAPFDSGGGGDEGATQRPRCATVAGNTSPS
ncbi:hypothetical protein [Streptomyces sp. A30]|uniref:hypothetical protein n=1 Tax=Streptomyces sp. A30 TaxID=2789273 RepID=UPI003980B61D